MALCSVCNASFERSGDCRTRCPDHVMRRAGEPCRSCGKLVKLHNTRSASRDRAACKSCRASLKAPKAPGKPLTRAPRACLYCSATFTPTHDAHARCATCRARGIGPRSAPCATCGELLPGGRGSLPVGVRTCQKCRRTAHERATIRTIQRRARGERRSKDPRGSTAERGYDRTHQVRRRAALAAFAPGDPCARCGQPMLEGDPLDLDHADDRVTYLGLSHAWCNRSRKPTGIPRPDHRNRSCAICGGHVSRPDRQRTCSRACGAVLRRLNAA